MTFISLIVSGNKLVDLLEIPSGQYFQLRDSAQQLNSERISIGSLKWYKDNRREYQEIYDKAMNKSNKRLLGVFGLGLLGTVLCLASAIKLKILKPID